MYIENGNLPVDLSSLAIAILSDEGTKEVQYLENQEQENLFQGQSYCNVNEINPSTTLINDDASKIYQEVCDCSLIQSKISKIEQCIDYFEVMVKEQAEEIHLLSLDMGHFSKKAPDTTEEENCNMECQGNGIFQFILTHLQMPRHSNIIRWTDKARKKFQIVDPKKFASMWGKEKNKENMTKGKLRRCLNYQARIGKIKRISNNHYYLNISKGKEDPRKIVNHHSTQASSFKKRGKYKILQGRKPEFGQSSIKTNASCFHQSVHQSAKNHQQQEVGGAFDQGVGYIKNVLSHFLPTAEVQRKMSFEYKNSKKKVLKKFYPGNEEVSQVLPATESTAGNADTNNSSKITPLASGRSNIFEMFSNSLIESKPLGSHGNQKQLNFNSLANSCSVVSLGNKSNQMFESDVEFYDENTNSFLEAEAFKDSPNMEGQSDETPNSSCDTCFFPVDKIDLDSLLKDLEDVDSNFRRSCNGALA